MHFLNSLVSKIMKTRMRQVELNYTNPLLLQENTLKYLLKKGKKTTYGKSYGFAQIKNYEQFKKQVPVKTYEDFEPLINKTMQGERDLLWQGTIKMFAKSSGTTSGKSKFLPVSEEALTQCHNKGGKDVITLFCHQNVDTQMFAGKSIIMGGSHQPVASSSNIICGDVSALMMQKMPYIARPFNTPPNEIALLQNWEEKLERIIETTIDQNITSISGVPSWTLVLLNKIKSKYKLNSILDVWQNLELYVHGGVSMLPYFEQFKKLIPKPNFRYIETYNSSEGFFAIQDNPFEDDLLLMNNYGIYYEFYPLGESEDKAVNLANIRLHKNYVMLISTTSGLWRYKIGDTVQFTSKFPFKLKITGRDKFYLNAFGEEVIMQNAEKAITFAAKKTNSIVKNYIAAPQYLSENNSGKHQWLIEFENEVTNLKEFAYYLDSALKDLNSDYEAKRFNNYILAMPEIIVAQKNTFYKWLERKNKLGGQNKIPKLNNKRDIFEEILELNK